MLLANLVRGDEPLVRVRRRHADVDDRDVGVVRANLQEQLVGIARLADDLEAAVLEQAGDALAEEDGVLGENDSRPLGLRLLQPSGEWSTRSGGKSAARPGTTSW